MHAIAHFFKRWLSDFIPSRQTPGKRDSHSYAVAPLGLKREEARNLPYQTNHKKAHKKKEQPHLHAVALFLKNGGYLLSHCYAVPLTLSGLTSLFGMGRGGTPMLKPPEYLCPPDPLRRGNIGKHYRFRHFNKKKSKLQVKLLTTQEFTQDVFCFSLVFLPSFGGVGGG